MTENDVRNIVIETIENYLSSLSGFTHIKPNMTTKEVSIFFGKSTDWVRTRRMDLGGKRINKRGDFAFDSKVIIDYKLRNRDRL